MQLLMDMFWVDTLICSLAHRDHNSTLMFAHNIHVYQAHFLSAFVELNLFDFLSIQEF